ncbi:hypothetical protein HCN44_009341 [Aphidius gifuensis]|uniref:Structural maintenance of chromosomes protein n=1 Tax=Aphidius gifuensis TaxID=684658 RepID=A0A834Y6B3_APHGI|nr:hypothetical protein HCN44_009341 [Aphidius gifuensis]
MHIKKLSICGFKSFQHLTVVDDLSKGHNAIVGKNGSGKSNLFHAIEFLFGEEYARLSAQRRQGLMHQGNGKTLSAFVEITFDNSDKKFPNKSDSIIIRREISNVKEVYYLNSKEIRRNSIMELLETACLFTKNSYNIIKQGKIQQIAIGNDKQRLDLLREISGVKYFDEQLQSWHKNLQKSDDNLLKYDDLINNELEKQFLIFDKQKHAFKKFHKLNTKRKCLEYATYQRDLNSNKNDLDIINLELNKTNIPSSKKQINKIIELITKEEDKLKDVDNELKSVEEQNNGLIDEKNELNKITESLDMEIADLEDEITRIKEEESNINKELSSVNKKIAEKENNSQYNYQALKEKKDQIMLQLAEKEQKRDELYSKEGRNVFFSDQSTRDNWITNELTQLKKQINNEITLKEKINNDLTIDKQNEKQKIDIKQKYINEMNEIKKLIDENNTEYHMISRNLNEEKCNRKILIRRENEIQQNLKIIQDKQQEIEKKLKFSILQGIKSVEKIYNDENIDGYHGTVADNISCDDNLYRAVSTVAKNRLFHHIVDTETIGIEILEKMKDKNLSGDVTFLPVNRVHSKYINYPTNKDCCPLVSKITCSDEQFDKIIGSIFGKTLVVRNIDTALNLETNLNCVTLSGDQVFSDGTMFGGFTNAQSNLELYYDYQKICEEYKQCEIELNAIKEEIIINSGKINNYIDPQQILSTKIERNKQNLKQLMINISTIKEELNIMENCKIKKEENLFIISSNLEKLYAKEKCLEDELKQDFSHERLTPDQRDLKNLIDEIQELQNQKQSINEQLKLDNKFKNEYEILIKHREELNKIIYNNSMVKKVNKLTTLKEEKENIETQFHKVSNDIEYLNEKIENLSTKKGKILEVIENLKKQKKQYEDILKDLENQVRSLIIDKKNKEKNIEDCLKNINDMGPLPNDKARSIFDDWSTNKIFEELTRVNIELEKLGNINNNFSNYEDYISKREWIIQRHGDAQERNIIIRNTIEELGLQKKEESAAMFKQINDNFVNIFKELVPDGQAKLVMLSGGNNNDQDDFDPDELVGIGISVSFDKKNCQMENLKKFSGGQKSIVALALIFAIQSYNPAPFYLFDEIDQALDPEYRKTVAKMIQKMSKNAQFITTTFRTELLQNAQKFYGVQCQNKISRVITVSKAEAINFIDEDLADK